jgi:tetratricopeptide (TPR) repeat protein
VPDSFRHAGLSEGARNQTRCNLALSRVRRCQSKPDWREFYSEFGESFLNLPDSRLCEEAFNRLRTDPLSVQYSVELWESLLEGSLTTWNLELGREIAQFASHAVKSTNFQITNAKIELESGFASNARKIAQRCRRKTTVSTSKKLQLDTIICSSYIEEGDRGKAIRLLSSIKRDLTRGELKEQDQADFSSYVARTEFLLGRYENAAPAFQKAAFLYEKLAIWEAAAKSFFNAAASLDNAGMTIEIRQQAFLLVEKCRSISSEHNLMGPLAHCEAFYGHNDYWHGNFAGALEHFKLALDSIPTKDRGYRRLHVLSMLAFTYLRTGRYEQAFIIGRETLDLAPVERSDRFFIRYVCLKAELMWHQGDAEGSQAVLIQYAADFTQNGIHTLEELTLYSRYLLQSSHLGLPALLNNVKISENLKKNQSSWCELLYSRGQSLLTARSFGLAENDFQACQRMAVKDEDLYHESVALLGLCQIRLMHNALAPDSPELNRLRIASSQMVEPELKTKILMIDAALQYRAGHFDNCVAKFKQARNCIRVSSFDGFLLDSWLAVTSGKACKLHKKWQLSALNTATAKLFAPTIRFEAPGRLIISETYEVDLRPFPAINDLMTYLLDQAIGQTTSENIQNKVWNQGTQQLGWEQKIRNATMRLRRKLPFTITPIVTHTEQLAFNQDGILYTSRPNSLHSTEEKVTQLLTAAPLSSLEISNRLNISTATTKRLLKKLTSQTEIDVFRCGKNIYYHAQQDSSNPTTH